MTRRQKKSLKRQPALSMLMQEGSRKDKRKKPPRRPAPLAGNKRQRKTFFSHGSGR